MIKFLILSVVIAMAPLLASAQLTPSPQLSPQCIADIAKVIGIKPGETYSRKYKSNDKKVSCDVNVVYDGSTLAFQLGIANANFKTIFLSPDLKTDKNYFVDTVCSADLNAPVGSYSNTIGYARHRRGFDGGFGQDSVYLQVAKDKNSIPNFHVSIVENVFGENNDSQDDYIEATCF